MDNRIRKNCRIERKPNMVLEAVGLLLQLKSSTGYAQLQKDIARKYGFSTPAMEAKFDLLCRIEADARSRIEEIQENLDLYFSGGAPENTTIGEVVLLWWDTNLRTSESLSEYRKRLSSLSETEWCKKYSNALGVYLDGTLKDSDYVEYETMIEVIQYILHMDVPDEQKLMYQSILVEREVHWDRLFAMLEWATEILKSYRDEMTAIAEECADYYTQLFEKITVEEYIEESIGFTLRENALGSVMTPYFTHPNMFNMMADGKEVITSPYYVIMGVLFDEDFELKLKNGQKEEPDQEYIEKVLKLLGDKSKFAILTYIKDKRAYGSELAKQLNLTTATISHHMGALFSAGLITAEEEDNRVYYRGNTEAIRYVLEQCEKALT